MPIIEPARSGVPLTQGDLLSGIALFATSLGFDAHSWPSTEDLRWLVTQGQTDIAAATVVVRQLEALKASGGVEGTQFKESDLITAQEKLDKLKERLEPYERERSCE
jgi:hypothetical protein